MRNKDKEPKLGPIKPENPDLKWFESSKGLKFNEDELKKTEHRFIYVTYK